MSDDEQKEVRQEPEPISFAEFLESTPPSSVTKITKLTETKQHPSYQTYELLTPEIQLHCPDDACNGTRFFRYSDDSELKIPKGRYEFLYISYTCSNCRKTQKTFSLAARRDRDAESGQCYKFGELPVYGPPTPPRLIQLIGPDRDLFLKGRRCENQGLGIGAFVYYRRVVENQKNRILEEIIKVSKKLSIPTSMITILEAAKAETQFSKALASVKDAMPQVLLINGHNPLTLLHSALSEGLHDRSDEHCLEIASSVRVVLAELSERLGQALKDEVELSKALSTLMSHENK